MALFGIKNGNVNFTYEATRDNFEKNKSFEERNFIKCPSWAEPEFDEDGNYADAPNPFLPIFDPFYRRKFYKEGQVAVGAIVQANVLLFKRGKEDLAANFIYTTEPYFIKKPDELLYMAEELFSTKGDRGYLPSIQKLADLLGDEGECIFRYRLPRDLMDNKEVYFTSVVVSRHHLPGKKLIPEVVYPMLVLPGSQPDAMILPYWYWKEI